MNSQESEKMDAVSKNAENNPAQENSSADEKNSYPAIPEDALIIIPVRNMVLFPGMVVPITIAREKSLAAAQAAMRGDRQIGVVLQKTRRLPTRNWTIFIRSALSAIFCVMSPRLPTRITLSVRVKDAFV